MSVSHFLSPSLTHTFLSLPHSLSFSLILSLTNLLQQQPGGQAIGDLSITQALGMARDQVNQRLCTSHLDSRPFCLDSRLYVWTLDLMSGVSTFCLDSRLYVWTLDLMSEVSKFCLDSGPYVWTLDLISGLWILCLDTQIKKRVFIIIYFFEFLILHYMLVRQNNDHLLWQR